MLEILERERIFLKKSFFEDFYLLNSQTYKWKFEPLNAVRVYIKNHPDAQVEQSRYWNRKKETEKKESTPQNSAAAPQKTQLQMWNEILKFLETKLDNNTYRNIINPNFTQFVGIKGDTIRFNVFKQFQPIFTTTVWDLICNKFTYLKICQIVDLVENKPIEKKEKTHQEPTETPSEDLFYKILNLAEVENEVINSVVLTGIDGNVFNVNCLNERVKQKITSNNLLRKFLTTKGLKINIM